MGPHELGWPNPEDIAKRLLSKDPIKALLKAKLSVLGRIEIAPYHHA